MGMCDVCKCELPINRCGHVPREVRRIHNQGAKHQAALVKRHSEQAEQQKWLDLQRQREREEADQKWRETRARAMALKILTCCLF